MTSKFFCSSPSGFHCESSRHRRSVDLEQEMLIWSKTPLGACRVRNPVSEFTSNESSLSESNYSSESLQACCVRGFSVLPMRRTCQERMRRVAEMDAGPECAQVFLTCCLRADVLRQRQKQEDAEKGFGRSENPAGVRHAQRRTAPSFSSKRFCPQPRA